MIRFLSSLAVCGLLTVGTAALAQTVLPDPNATPALPPSRVPPSSVTPKIQAQVIHERRLVSEVRENTDNIQNKGDFGAQLWLVEGDQFFQNWRKPEAPTIDPISLVQRGQTISTAIIFYGTARSTTGISNVDYDVVVKRPDGTIYVRRDEMIGWQDLTPADRRLMLGRNYVSVDFGLDDPAGVYTVEATVRDNVSRQYLALKQTFVLQADR